MCVGIVCILLNMHATEPQIMITQLPYVCIQCSIYTFVSALMCSRCVFDVLQTPNVNTRNKARTNIHTQALTLYKPCRRDGVALQSKQCNTMYINSPCWFENISHAPDCSRAVRHS